MSPPLRVAVVGFGPGGMFFCHHAERYRQKLLSQGKSVDALPLIQCFEKAHQPGGNWRADRVNQESLWTNGPKEAMEFFDYTFAQHFGSDTKLPSYLTRSSVRDYIMARCTRTCPDFVQKYAQLNTQVTQVSYSKDTMTFTVETLNLETQKPSVQEFDRCIWAAGENGIPSKPAPLLRALHDFTRGPIFHSSELCDFEQNATGKHLLLIGGSYSAVDIALHAIKRGAERITIVIRHVDHTVPALWISSWLKNKVQIVQGMVPVGVDDSNQSILCAPWDLETEQPVDSSAEAFRIERIEEVDTIVLCTGYQSCYEMLDGSQNNWQAEEDDALYELDNELQIPKDWNTRSDDEFEALLGHVPVPPTVQVSDLLSVYCYHGCIYALNPNYMYVYAPNNEHILAIDVLTHLMFATVVGETKVPSREAIVEYNRKTALEGMSIPNTRYYLDPDYRLAVRKLYQAPGGTIAYPDDSLSRDFYFRRLAQAAKDGKYPVDFGDINGLSALGKQVIEMDSHCWHYSDPDDYSTCFRDLTEENCQFLKSIHTGKAPVPFNGLWMKLDDQACPSTMVQGNNTVSRRL